MATTLTLAEQNHAEELKRVCLEFASRNLSTVMCSEGYHHMISSCPQLQVLTQSIKQSINSRFLSLGLIRGSAPAPNCRYPLTQSSHQSTNQSIDQSTQQSINSSIHQSIHPSINQSTNHPNSVFRTHEGSQQTMTGKMTYTKHYLFTGSINHMFCCPQLCKGLQPFLA